MTEVDHDAALQQCHQWKGVTGCIDDYDWPNVARAYLDLHDKSRHLALLQINPEAERVVTLLKDQEAELADLHDTLKSWQLGFEQDAKWSEMQAELADLRLIAEAAEVCVRKGGMMNAQRLANALTTWRTRTEKT